MKISFVIPAHNEESCIRDCLESLISAIHWHDYETEIIVVNNASTDQTKQIAQSFSEVTVVDEPQKGLARARQAGFNVSTGDLIANIDADTILTKAWIRTVFQEFEHNDDLVALSGPFIYHDLPIVTRALVRLFYYLAFGLHAANHYILKKGAVVQGGNFVLRRTALERIGGYDTRFDFYGEDTDIARRIQEIGRVKFTLQLPICTSGRRLKKEGVVRMGLRYAVNYFWTTFLKRPYTKDFRDIRE